MSYLPKWIAVAGVVAMPAMQAQNYNLSEYKPSPGLTASAVQKTLTVTWDGEKNDELRLRLLVQNGTPLIEGIDLRQKEEHGPLWPRI